MIKNLEEKLNEMKTWMNENEQNERIENLVKMVERKNVLDN